MLPVTWANVTNFSFIGQDQIGGNVTVTACSPRWLPGDWECRGNFAYDDPMANGDAVTPGVVLANDTHRYPAGALVGLGNQLGVALLPGTHRAYQFGFSYGLSILELVLGLMLCVMATAVALVSRRGPWLRVTTTVTTALLVIGIPLVLTQLHRFSP